MLCDLLETSGQMVLARILRAHELAQALLHAAAKLLEAPLNEGAQTDSGWEQEQVATRLRVEKGEELAHVFL